MPIPPPPKNPELSAQCHCGCMCPCGCKTCCDGYHCAGEHCPHEDGREGDDLLEAYDGDDDQWRAVENWRKYWGSLTPEEKQREIELGHAYGVSESKGPTEERGPVMPCYDPGDGPGPFERVESQRKSRTLTLIENNKRYMETLNDIEAVCSKHLPDALSTMGEISGNLLAQEIMGIINEHWGEGRP